MNRKGISSEALLTGALAVAFILVFILFLSGSFGKIAGWINVYSFNNSVERVVEKEIVRYSIIEDKVLYFNGREGIDIEERVVLNEKLLDEEELKKEFAEDYYYDFTLRELRSVAEGKKSDFYEVTSGNVRADIAPNLKVIPVSITKNDERCGRASVSLILRSVEDSNKKIYGNLIACYDGEVWFSRLNGDGQFSLFAREQSSGKFKEIADETAIWRDEVVNELIRLSYVEDKGKGDRVSERFNVEKVDDYLVVRLDEAVL